MRLIFLSLLACIMPFILPAQNAPDLKPRISKNIYFDISPPLRDMLKTPPPKADMSWKDGIVLNHPKPAEKSKNGSQPGIDRTVQNYQGTSAADTLLLSFDGSNNINSVAPPDCDGDVGPNHYFDVVNCH